jgi:hypothetical protein
VPELSIQRDSDSAGTIDRAIAGHSFVGGLSYYDVLVWPEESFYGHFENLTGTVADIEHASTDLMVIAQGSMELSRILCIPAALTEAGLDCLNGFFRRTVRIFIAVNLNGIDAGSHRRHRGCSAAGLRFNRECGNSTPGNSSSGKSQELSAGTICVVLSHGASKIWFEA